MARIAGVDLPREKRIEIGLTYIYGIGRPSADKILAKAEVNPCLLYTSPSPRDRTRSRMPSSA